MIYYYSQKEKFSNNLDLTILFSEIDKNKNIFKNICGIDKYIENWKTVFFETYSKEKTQIFNFNNTLNYYTSINVANSEIRIHFNIDKALSLSTHYNIETLKLEQFGETVSKYALVKYSDCNIVDRYFPISNAPVIIVPYFYCGFIGLVIDGNHRISYYKAREKNTKINCVYLTPQDSSSLIFSTFEKAIYLFLLEGKAPEYFANNSFAQYFKNGKFTLN